MQNHYWVVIICVCLYCSNITALLSISVNNAVQSSRPTIVYVATSASNTKASATCAASAAHSSAATESVASTRSRATRRWSRANVVTAEQHLRDTPRCRATSGSAASANSRNPIWCHCRMNPPLRYSRRRLPEYSRRRPPPLIAITSPCWFLPWLTSMHPRTWHVRTRENSCSDVVEFLLGIPVLTACLLIRAVLFK